MSTSDPHSVTTSLNLALPPRQQGIPHQASGRLESTTQGKRRQADSKKKCVKTKRGNPLFDKAIRSILFILDDIDAAGIEEYLTSRASRTWAESDMEQTGKTWRENLGKSTPSTGNGGNDLSPASSHSKAGRTQRD
ncbi:hypothetical protein PSDVSF_14010 [Pseudodesulfovibrio sediminis]|uniref:Uncharacterized protein n=2 Tax=Pseudodesulfovibrio sediminis TaxID=2810563 RepID=A0ABM7P3D1_9BACT|nr:hypothetical protein PSDVSF_14010 [Pseudodesulfovibrio sediminis]